MQAVILAGGLGTRLQSLNLAVPKPMVDVAGAPFLRHLILMLTRHQISRFLLLLGYKYQTVIDHFQATPIPRTSILWSVEPTPMGTGGALKYAESLLEPEFLFINGDSYLDLDYQDFIQTFRATGIPCLMAVYNNQENTDVIKNVTLNHDGHVTQYVKNRNDSSLTHIDAGVIALKRVVVDRIPTGTPCSFENEIYAQLIVQNQLRGYIAPHRFYDIGTPQRIKDFEEAMRRDHLTNTL